MSLRASPAWWKLHHSSRDFFLIVFFPSSAFEISRIFWRYFYLYSIGVRYDANRSVSRCGYALPQFTLLISIFLYILHLANGREGRLESACAHNSNLAWGCYAGFHSRQES